MRSSSTLRLVTQAMSQGRGPSSCLASCETPACQSVIAAKTFVSSDARSARPCGRFGLSGLMDEELAARGDQHAGDDKHPAGGRGGIEAHDSQDATEHAQRRKKSRGVDDRVRISGLWRLLGAGWHWHWDWDLYWRLRSYWSALWRNGNRLDRGLGCGRPAGRAELPGRATI